MARQCSTLSDGLWGNAVDSIQYILREAIDGDTDSLRGILEGVVQPDAELVKRCFDQAKRCLADPRVMDKNTPPEEFERVLSEYKTDEIGFTSKPGGNPAYYVPRTRRIWIRFEQGDLRKWLISNYYRLLVTLRHEATHKSQHKRSDYASKRIGNNPSASMIGSGLSVNDATRPTIRHANTTSEIMNYAREAVRFMSAALGYTNKRRVFDAIGNAYFNHYVKFVMPHHTLMTRESKNLFYKYAYMYADQFPD